MGENSPNLVTLPVAKFPPGLGQVAGVSHLSKFIFIFGAKIS
jgi:hypothetical protein